MTTTGVVTLRRAVAGDLDVVVAVFLECWRGSYAAVLPSSLVDSLSDEDARALWSRALSRGDRDVVVGTVGGTVSGVVSSGRDETDPTVAWVHSLYVSPSAQGRGLGGALLGHAVRSMSETGVSGAHLWVFAANSPSLAFYASHGWQPDGATRVEAQFGEPELRLSRSVDADQSPAARVGGLIP